MNSRIQIVSFGIKFTRDCNRMRHRIASDSRSPSLRSHCGTGSCTGSCRGAGRRRRRPRGSTETLASFGTMPGKPEKRAKVGTVIFSFTRQIKLALSWRLFFSLQPSASWMSESERFMSPRSIRDSRKRSRSGTLVPEEGVEGSLARAPIEER